MSQWVKNPTAAAWVAAEVWVPSSAQCGEYSELKSQCSRSYSLGGSRGLASVSGLGTSMCRGCDHLRKRKERKPDTSSEDESIHSCLFCLLYYKPPRDTSFEIKSYKFRREMYF